MEQPLRVGLAGVGVGARQLLPALSSSEHIRFTAAADVRIAALEQLAGEFGVETFSSVESLCESPTVEAVWIATPNQFHAAHVIAAAERGKHVIVSKPMAITLNEAEEMNAAAERNNVHLIAGHTQSMAPTIRRMAEMVRAGTLGRLGMVHTWHFTDWMYRPRLPEELDVALGGGPVFRQASHQVDIVRLICGGLVREVRATTVALNPERVAAGAYSAFLEFQDGTPATIVYSGYGHFDLSAMLHGSEKSAARATTSMGPPRTVAEEAALKESLRYSGGGSSSGGANTLGLFGLTLVTCEKGDLRESTEGLYVYQQGARSEIKIADELRGAAELEELYQAVRNGAPLLHSGRWGEATLEVCIAIHESSQAHRPIVLTRQNALPAGA